MKLGQMLIDRAVEICGTARELAKRTNMTPGDISKLRAGIRPLSPEIAAEIAEIAGLDAREAAIDAIIERNADTRKGMLLAEILGKGQAVGVAAMSGISYSGDSRIDSAVIKSNSEVVKNRIHRIYYATLKKMGEFLTSKNRALAYG